MNMFFFNQAKPQPPLTTELTWCSAKQFKLFFAISRLLVGLGLKFWTFSTVLFMQITKMTFDIF